MSAHMTTRRHLPSRMYDPDVLDNLNWNEHEQDMNTIDAAIAEQHNTAAENRSRIVALESQVAALTSP